MCIKGFTTFVQKNVRDQKIENLLPDSKYDVTITPIYGDNKGVGKVLTAETGKKLNCFKSKYWNRTEKCRKNQ